MTEPLTRQRASDAIDPLGWRLILGVAVTHVRVSSLAQAAEAAALAVTAAGAAGDGHLSADLHSDRLVLRLQTAAIGALTEHDLGVARTVTEALAARSFRTEPGFREGDGDAVPQTIEIAIDALDITLIRPFWKAVTGFVDEPGASDLPGGGLMDPLRRGPTIWFQQMDEPRIQRNRIHLDVDVPVESARPRIDAALAAGGRLVSDAAAPAFWVLADAEGNEVCVCTWQGRD